MNTIVVYEAINKKDKFTDNKFICRSKGVACDLRKTESSPIESSVLKFDDSERSKLSVTGTPIYRAFDKSRKFSCWRFVREDAIKEFTDEFGTSDSEEGDILVQQCLLNSVYIPRVEFPCEVNIVRSNQEGRDELIAFINLHPESHGRKFAKSKVCLIDRSWTDVAEGPAIVAISKECGRFFFVTGAMVRFDGITEDDLRKLCSNNTFVASSDIYEVDSPVRGKYYCFSRSASNKTYFLVRKKKNKIFYTSDYSDIIAKDIEENGCKNVKLYDK